MELEIRGLGEGGRGEGGRKHMIGIGEQKGEEGYIHRKGTEKNRIDNHVPRLYVRESTPRPWDRVSSRKHF